MATVASAGLNMIVEYTKANPYGVMATGIVIGASMLAFRAVGKCQKSAAAVPSRRRPGPTGQGLRFAIRSDRVSGQNSLSGKGGSPRPSGF